MSRPGVPTQVSHRYLGIEVVETWENGRHVLTIIDVNTPQPAQVPNERLFGLGTVYRRRYGGEWVCDFETNEMRRA